MKFASKNLKNIEAYKLASHKIWENLELDILKLDWNEATIPASPMVKQKVVETIENIGFRYYPDVNNIELYEALADYCNVSISNVEYFASSDAAHEYIIRSFIDLNDKICILGPTYENFRVVCQSVGAKIKLCYEECDSGLSEFEKILKVEKPKLAYICNPNNPTGRLYELVELEQIVSQNPDVLFIIDEAYYEFCGISASNLTTVYDNLLVTRTFSKAFALANFRIGYIITNNENIKAIKKIRNAKNISTLSQVAALAALKSCDYTFRYINEVNSAKVIFETELENYFDKKVEIIKGHGNFVLVRFDTTRKKSDFIRRLHDENIFIRDLSHVRGLANCVRITVGTKLQMKRVINVIRG